MPGHMRHFSGEMQRDPIHSPFWIHTIPESHRIELRLVASDIGWTRVQHFIEVRLALEHLETYVPNFAKTEWHITWWTSGRRCAFPLGIEASSSVELRRHPLIWCKTLTQVHRPGFEWISTPDWWNPTVAQNSTIQTMESFCRRRRKNYCGTLNEILQRSPIGLGGPNAPTQKPITYLLVDVNK